MHAHMNRPVLPWWRVPMVWMVLAGPALVVLASLITMVIAFVWGDTPLADMPARAATAGDTMAPAAQARNHAATPRR